MLSLSLIRDRVSAVNMLAARGDRAGALAGKRALYVEALDAMAHGHPAPATIAAIVLELERLPGLEEEPWAAPWPGGGS